MKTLKIELSRREMTFHDVCMADHAEVAGAIERAREELGRSMITSPQERANVAAIMAADGWDGIGRANGGLERINEAAKSDMSLPDYVAGR